MTAKPDDLLASILKNPASPWMDGSGDLADVVISSRVRLARNLQDVPFPHLLDERQAKEALEKVSGAVSGIAGKAGRGPGNRLHIYDLDQVPALDRQVLVEKHLMSPQHAQPGFGKGLVLSADEKVSIMVNEEDHVRLQCLYSGLELDEAWITASGMDDLLEERLDFAYDERSGFLTACPTNVGTGLRASVMVHLPALAMGDEVSKLLSSINKLGLVVRGLFGEGTEGLGNVFQVSNQITLGQTEKEIIENLSLVTKQVVAEEKKYRDTLEKTQPRMLEDRIFRAWGILSNARSMSTQEAVKLWSDVRLGVELGMMPTLGVKEVNQVLVIAQPCFIQKAAGGSLPPEERDAKRAEIIRSHLVKKPS